LIWRKEETEEERERDEGKASLSGLQNRTVLSVSSSFRRKTREETGKEITITNSHRLIHPTMNIPHTEEEKASQNLYFYFIHIS
jgi:hypothetical protein